MTESMRHISYKELVAVMLDELKDEGMKIKNIDHETQIITKYKTKTVIEDFKYLDNLYKCEIEISKRVIPITVYLCWTDDIINASEVLVNGKKYFELDKGAEYHYTNGRCNYIKGDNFGVVDCGADIVKRVTGLRIQDIGSTFIVIVPYIVERNVIIDSEESRKLSKKYREPKITYAHKIEKVITKRRSPIYDVTCKYKGIMYKFEIGESNHKNEKDVLVLSYNYLLYNSYLEIKQRVRKFLVKQSKVNSNGSR